MTSLCILFPLCFLTHDAQQRGASRQYQPFDRERLDPYLQLGRVRAVLEKRLAMPSRIN